MDDIDGTALEGAVFKIVDMNGNDVRTGITTDAKGKISISDLHPETINLLKQQLLSTIN